MKKATVVSPANIAFIKYWGNTGDKNTIPLNKSISMTLSDCLTTTTASVSGEFDKDEILIRAGDGTYSPLDDTTTKGTQAYKTIENIRKMAKSQDFVHIKTHNSFPADSGIASSASGMSALTGALLLAYGQPEVFKDKTELSRIVRRQGSASAARSVFGGFVELGKGGDQAAAASQVTQSDHWNLVDHVVIVSSKKKSVSSSEGHKSAASSPYLTTRIKEMEKRVTECKKAILSRNFGMLSQVSEADTLSMHAVMMTSNPPIIYFEPGTMSVIQEVIKMKNEGISCFYSIDAGPNVHVICESKNAKSVFEILIHNPFVHKIITNQPCEGLHEVKEHLF